MASRDTLKAIDNLKKKRRADTFEEEVSRSNKAAQFSHKETTSSTSTKKNTSSDSRATLKAIDNLKKSRTTSSKKPTSVWEKFSSVAKPATEEKSSASTKTSGLGFQALYEGSKVYDNEYRKWNNTSNFMKDGVLPSKYNELMLLSAERAEKKNKYTEDYWTQRTAELTEEVLKSKDFLPVLKPDMTVDEEMSRVRATHEAIRLADIERGKVDSELESLKKQIDDLTAELNGTRDANFLDMTWNAAKRGFYNSKYGAESWKEMQGLENSSDYYKDILESDDYNFRSNNWFTDMVSGAFELGGQMVEPLSDPYTWNLTLGSGMAAGSAAAIAGQLGPQVAAPEEVVTVPAATVAGMFAGYSGATAKRAMEVEGGHAYRELIENGVSRETATAIATAVGGVNGLLEALQVDDLLDSFKILAKTGADETALQMILKELERRGVNALQETAQEVAQEGVTMAGVEIGSRIDTGKGAFTAEEVYERLTDTASSSFLSFVGMGLLPSTANVTRNILSKKGNKTALTLDEVTTIGQDVISHGDEGISSVVEAGLKTNELSKANELARDIQKKRDAGKVVTSEEVGRLVEAIVKETINTESSTAVEETTADTPATLEEAAMARVNDESEASTQTGEDTDVDTESDPEFERFILDAINSKRETSPTYEPSTWNGVEEKVEDGKESTLDFDPFGPPPGYEETVSATESNKTEVNSEDNSEVGNLPTGTKKSPTNKIGELTDATRELIGNKNKVVSSSNGTTYLGNKHVAIPISEGDVSRVKSEWGVTDSENLASSVESTLNEYDFTPISANPIEGTLPGNGKVYVYTAENGQEIAVSKKYADYFEGYQLSAAFSESGVPRAIKATDADGNFAGMIMGIRKNREGQYDITDAREVKVNSPQQSSVTEVKAPVDAVAQRKANEDSFRKLTGYGDAGVRAFADIVASLPAGDISLVKREFGAAYELGLTNADPSKVNLQNDLQIKAFKAGLQDYNQSQEAKKTNVPNVKSHGKKAGFDATNAPHHSTRSQKRIVDKLYKAFGVVGGIGKTGHDANAEIKNNIGRVTISKNFKTEIYRDGEVFPVTIVYHAAHEIAMHRLMELAPKEGQAFVNALYRYMNMDGAMSLAEAKREEYATQGEKISLADAMEEVVANRIFELYNFDEKAFERALDRIIAENGTLAQKGAYKFKQILGKIISKLNSIVRTLTGKERKEIQTDIDELAKLRNLFEKAASAAVAKSKELAKNKVASNEVLEEFDGGTKFSIKEIIDEDGNSYGIGVYLDSDILSEMTETQRIEEVLKRVKAMGGKGFVAYDSSGNAIDVRIGKTAQTFRNHNGRRVPVNRYFTKYLKNEVRQEAILLVDELLASAKYVRSSKSKYSHGWLDDNGQNDWEYWSVFIQEKNKTVWEAILNIATTTNGEKYLYNIHPIKKAERSTMSDTTTADEIILDSSEKVKENFPAKDSTGKALTKGQQEYFKDSKVRDENGNLLVMYQGSQEDFTVFDRKKSKYSNLYGRGFYFTNSESHASQYGNAKAYYLDIKNPVSTTETTITEAQMKKFLEAVAEVEDYGLENYGYGATPESVLKSVYGKTDFLMLNDVSQTAIGDTVVAVELFNKVNGTEFDGFILETETVTFQSEQAKLTSNENPTSNPDTRFSLKQPVEQTKSLLALHNLTEEKLLKTLALGGFPMPSIAVTKSDIPHTNFGDITMVMSKDTIDPQANKKNTVYSADAWTPVVPNVEYEVNPEAEMRLHRMFYDLSRKHGRDAVEVLYGYGNTLEDKLNREGGAEGIISKLKDDTKMMNVFLLDSGKDRIEDVHTEKVDRLSDAKIGEYKYIIDALGEDVLNEAFPSDGESAMDARIRWVKTYGEKLRSAYADYLLSLGIDKTDVDEVMQSSEFSAGKLIRNVVVPARNYLKNGAETTTRTFSRELTDKAIRDAVNTEEYEVWLQNNFGDAEKSKGVYNNKDYYTPSGNRRSFSATHYPYTLDGIVKAMASQNGGNTKSVSGFVGIKTLRAGTAERFKSIADMHKREDRLQHLTEAEANAISDALSDRMHDIMLRILEKSNRKSDNRFIQMDSVGEILTEVAESGKYTIDNISKIFAQYGYDIENAIASEVRDLLFDTTQMPVNIFEAKPERAVGFDEVLAAVIPDSASDNLKAQLEKVGVNILTYEKGNDSDRLAKVNSVENAKFSLKGKERNVSLKEIAKLRQTIEDLKENHKETVKALKQEFKDQLKVSKRITLSKKAIDKVAKGLLKDYDSKADVTEVQNALNEFYNDMVNAEADGWDALYERVQDVASDMIKEAVVVDDTVYQEAKAMRDYFRKVTIKVNSEYKHDLGQYENINEFRKANLGRFNVSTKSGIPIGDMWSEMCELFPQFFSEDVWTTPEQLTALEEAFKAIQPIEYNPYSQNVTEATTYLANDILARFSDIPEVKTIADKAKERVLAERAKGKEKVAKVRTEMRDRIKAAVAEGREKAKKAVLGEKMATARDLKKLQNQYEARLSKMSESQKAKVLRKRIATHVGELSRKLLNGTDKTHIPENLKGIVLTLLENINLESNYSYDPESGSLKKSDKGLPTKRTQAFRELQKIYGEMRNELVISEDILGTDGLLQDVIDLNDLRIAEMTSEQLQKVWTVVQSVEGTISSVNTMFSEGKYEHVSGYANALLEDNSGKSYNGERKHLSGIKNLLSLDMLTPETYFHMLGEAGDSIFRMMRNAQDKHIRIMKEVADFTKETLGKVKVSELESKLHTVSLGGRDVKLTTAQIMELYVLVRRNQAKEHILLGGILPDVRYEGSKKLAEVEPIRGISEASLGKVFEVLSADEKALAEKLQHFASTVLSEYGNEASMQVYNYRKFNEKNYWTIRTNQDEVHSDIGKDTAVTTVANRGFAKATKPHANTSVRIGSIFDTFSAHSSEMATYASWLAVTEDVNRIRNFVFWNDSGRTGTVKGILKNVHGQKGAAYLEKLLTDIAVGVKAIDDMNMLTKLTGAYKASAIGANIRVIIQQPTSILRAMDMIGGQWLAAGATKSTRKGWEKAKKYAAIAQWKDWGHFDISTGRQMKDVLFDNASVLEKTRQVGMWGASAADSMAWGLLWNAVEAETKSKHKELSVGTTKFYQAVAERFTEIVDHTQVVDGILQRSQIMRSRSDLVKMATSFMGEPTKQYNMVMSTAYDAIHAKGNARKKAVARLGRTAATLGVSGIINAMAQSLVDALRDDDKEKDYWEKWIEAFCGGDAFYDNNLADTVNPLNYVPFLKDIWSALNGYDAKRMDMESITKVVNAAKNMYKAITGEGKYTIASASANLFAEVARLWGIPVANLKRDVKSIAMTTVTESDNYVGQYYMEKASLNLNYENNGKTFFDILYNSYTNDEEAYDIIYNDMVEGGIDKERIRKAMESRMKKAEGVDEVKLLEERFYHPEQKGTYNSSMKRITSSDAWKSASKDDRVDAKELLHSIIYRVDKELNEKLDGLDDYGIDDAEYVLYQLALDVHNTDGEKPVTKTEFVDGLQSLNFNSDELWGLYLDRYDSKGANYAREAGVSGETYLAYLDNLGDISDGKTVKKSEAVDAIQKLNLDSDDSWAIYFSEFDDSGAKMAQQYGVKGDKYIDFRDTLDKVDEYYAKKKRAEEGNPNDELSLGSYSQDEVAVALDMVKGLSRRDKAIIWQSMNKQWKTRNNPFL